MKSMKIKQTVEKVTIKSKVSYFRFIKVVNPRLKKGGKNSREPGISSGDRVLALHT